MSFPRRRESLPVGRQVLLFLDSRLRGNDNICMTVMVFGTFDGLHKGHLSYFRQARKFGDHLIAVVALDKNVLKFKGHLPKFNQTERLSAVKKCPLVNEARLGKYNRLAVIAELKPTVICLGYDQAADIKSQQTKFPKIKIIRLKPYQSKIYKSSLLNGNERRVTSNEN